MSTKDLSADEFAAKQSEVGNDFGSRVELLLLKQQEGTAAKKNAGAQDLNNHPINSSSSSSSSNNAIIIPQKTYETNDATKFTLPSLVKTNKNIQAASSLEINASSKRSSNKSLSLATRTQYLGLHLTLAANGALDDLGIKLGNDPTYTQIAATGKTLTLAPQTDRDQVTAHKLVQSGRGGANIPNSSKGCVAAVISYGCGGIGGTHSSVIQFTDKDGNTSIHTTGHIESRQLVSVYSMDGLLLQICLSMQCCSPNLFETLGKGLLSDHNDDNSGQDKIASYQDILNAGPAGLRVGNGGTRANPERLFILKATIEDEYILPLDKRQQLLKDGKEAQSNAGKKRMGAGGGRSEYLYVVSNGNGVRIGKAEKFRDIKYNKTNNKDGLRPQFGKSYQCGAGGPTHKPRPGNAVVMLSDDLVLTEMNHQKDNNMAVVGFHDNNKKRERYIVILEDKEGGLTAEQQYQQLEVPVMSQTADKKSTTVDKKRKAKSEPEQKKTSRR